MNQEANSQDVNEQEAVAPVEATEQTSIPEAPKEPEEGSKEFNFRQMEQKNRQLEQRLFELSEKIGNVAQPVIEKPDEFAGLQDDDLITFGQVNKITEKLAAQKAAQIVQQEFDKREKEQQPLKARAAHKDYDQVVNDENIRLLIKEDPDLEHDIRNAKDPYARAYKEVKKSNFFREKYANVESKQKLEENSKKPLSSNSLGSQRPLSQANSYSKEQLWEEMQRCGDGFI